METLTEAARVEILGSMQNKIITLTRRTVELDGRLELEVTSRKVATPKVLLVFSFNSQTSEVDVK
jgi:hypothetical protein